MIDGTIYVGANSTKNVNDGYLGSGNVIREKIKQYGKSAFKREILGEYETRRKLMEAEKKHVNLDFLKCDNVMNLCVGGFGSFSFKRMYRREPEYIPMFDKYVVIESSVELLPNLTYEHKAHNVFADYIRKNKDRFLTELAKVYNNKNTHEYAVSIIKKVFGDNYRLVETC